MSKPTKREVAIASKWYDKGRASGLDQGRVEGRKAAVDSAAADLSLKKAQALVELAKAMSQALNSVAGILDNAHGILR